MELTVLGKYGPYGKAGTGAASGYLVTNGNTSLVCDMGAGTLARLTGAFDVSKLDAVYFSHLHYDHTSDFLPFRYLLEDLGKHITVFCKKEDTDWYRLLFTHPLIHTVDVDEGTEITLGSMCLSFLTMEHTVPDLAVRIKGDATLCYTGDTLMNDNIALLFKGADCVLADVSKPSGFKGPHMNVENAKALSNEFGVKIIATHLSVDYDPTPEFSEYDNITVAEEGKTYRIDRSRI